MKMFSNSMSNQFADYSVTVFFSVTLNSFTDVAQSSAGYRFFNSAVERLFGYFQEIQDFRFHFSDWKSKSRVAVIPVHFHTAIDRDNVTGFQFILTRNSVNDL